MARNPLQRACTMQTDAYSSPEKKRVALIGIPDDALDVLNHYTQSSDWEAVVVVSESYEDYAVRMAEILGVPVASTVDRELLIDCDLVIVGESVSLTVAEVRETVAGTGIEVTTVNEVTESLGILPFQDAGGEPASLALAAEDIDTVLDGIGLPGSPPPRTGAAVPESLQGLESTEPEDSVEPAAIDQEPSGVDSGPGLDVESGAEPDPEPAGEMEPEAAIEWEASPAIEPEPETEPETDPAVDSSAAEIEDSEGPDVPPTGSIEEFEVLDGTVERLPDTEPDLDHQEPEREEAPPVPSLETTESIPASARSLAGSDVLPVDGKHDALRALLARVLERTGAKTGSLLVPEPGGERLRFATAVGLPAEIVAETRPRVGEGLAGKAYSTGKPQALLAEVPDLAEVGNSVRYRLAASTPICREARVIAVLSVNVESTRPIDEPAILDTLQGLVPSAEAAVLEAVDLPRLDFETRRGFLLARLDEIMGAADPFPARLRAVADLLRRGVGADYAHVYLVDPLSRRLELATSTDGFSAGSGRTLSLDRGFLGWIARSPRCALVTVPDPDGRTERALAGLPVHAGGPYALVVLEQFEVRPGERGTMEELLTGVLRQLEEIFEVERGVESQDVLSGLKMRIADQSSQLEILPPELRAQAALEFAIQILAAEAAVWLPGPSENPVIAQPQTRQAARIVADVWDELERVGAWVRERGATAQGGKGPGWDAEGPQGPSPYVGVKDVRGDGVLLAFFAAGEEGGPVVQLPARILLEALSTVAALIPESTSSDGKGSRTGMVDREDIDRMVVQETRRAQRSGRAYALTRFELEGGSTEEGTDHLRRFIAEHKRAVDMVSEIEPGVFIMLSPDTDPDQEGLRERYQGLWEVGDSESTLVIGRCRFPYYESSADDPKLVSQPGAERRAA